jgi:Fe2+ or Zn2+ uptake regulation protein
MDHRAVKTLDTPLAGVTHAERLKMREQVLNQLWECGIKTTKAMAALVDEMLLHERPITISELNELPTLEMLNPTTLYRLITKMEQVGVVRRIGLHTRAAHYRLGLPGEQRHYIVCTSCGDVCQVHPPKPSENVEGFIAQQTGWWDVRQQLEFFGTCPQCSL